MTYYIIFHIICGILSYGFLFAHVQREWSDLSNPNSKAYKDYVELGITGQDKWKSERLKDIYFCFITSIFGPINLIAAFLFTDMFKHGIKFSLTPDEL